MLKCLLTLGLYILARHSQVKHGNIGLPVVLYLCIGLLWNLLLMPVLLTKRRPLLVAKDYTWLL